MILYSQWRSLPLHQRAELAKHFGIAKVGPTHVVDNRIESDGYRVEDVENALSLERMQDYTGSKSTDWNVLWDALKARLEGRPVPQEEVAAIVSEPTIVNDVEVKPKRKYTRKAK